MCHKGEILFAASLDFDRFYRTIPAGEADAVVRASLSTPDATFVGKTGIERRIHNAAPERRMNVVLVSVESFSAGYSGTYGNPVSLTPELDKLTADSLVFSRLYASGTRTVRGLEAPPVASLWCRSSAVVVIALPRSRERLHARQLMRETGLR